MRGGFESARGRAAKLTGASLLEIGNQADGGPREKWVVRGGWQGLSGKIGRQNVTNSKCGFAATHTGGIHLIARYWQMLQSWSSVGSLAGVGGRCGSSWVRACPGHVSACPQGWAEFP
jgi:hypothetical protein